MDQLNWHKLQAVGSTYTGSSTDDFVPANCCQKTQQAPEAVLGTAFSGAKKWQVMKGRC